MGAVWPFGGRARMNASVAMEQVREQGVHRRYLGALVGLAVGDALGAPIEGCRPGQLHADRGYGRWWNLGTGGRTLDG